MSLTTRLATIEDVDLLQDLWVKSHDEHFGPKFLEGNPVRIHRHKTQFENVLSGKMDGKIYIGYKDDQPVAYTWVSLNVEEKPQAAFLTELFATGQGNGSEMLDLAETIAMAHNRTDMLVDSFRQSVGFYEKKNYSLCRQQRGDNLVSYEKKLTI